VSVKEQTHQAIHAYKAANAAYDQATQELRERCREARAAGIPVAEVAKLALVSRQTVYDWTSDG
jgi:DNA invertase Pin-like site-specific DNA recombinase